MDYIYLGEEGVGADVLDAAWATCSDPAYWTSVEHVAMARLALSNGLAVALWVGAFYLIDMIAEFLAVEA